MARGDFSGYVLIVSSPDSTGPVFLTNEQLKDVTEDPEAWGVTSWLDDVPENQDPNYWGEGAAVLLKVRFAKLIPVEQVTKYEVQLADDR